MAVTGQPITAAQLAELSPGKRVELVRGEIVAQAQPGGEHGCAVANLGSLLAPYIRTRKFDRAGIRWGVVLSRHPDTVRDPDIAFVSPSA